MRTGSVRVCVARARLAHVVQLCSGAGRPAGLQAGLPVLLLLKGLTLRPCCAAPCRTHEKQMGQVLVPAKHRVSCELEVRCCCR